MRWVPQSSKLTLPTATTTQYPLMVRRLFRVCTL